MDQMYVSKAEVSATGYASYFAIAVNAADVVFTSVCKGLFQGTRLWSRLAKTAARKKMTPMRYAMRYLVK